MMIEELVSSYPDFPKKGILFRDMFPILRSPAAMTSMLNQLGDFSDRLTPDYIVGIESRGFIIGTALATRQRMGFIPIRKKGKLPGDVIGVDYSLEYGQDRLEIQSDIVKDQNILLVDDLLATGGTVNAASQLIDKAGGRIVGCAFVIELLGLNGRDNIPNIPTTSLIKYD
tara:strand:- start:2282 stop:2794 length:513 start_codon:yes stop_codon:yes gene_type:complete